MTPYLSTSVYASQTSFPLQPDMFRCSSFVHRVLDLCTEWVRGFNPAEAKSPQQQKRGAFIYQCVSAANDDANPDLSLLIGTLVGVNDLDGARADSRHHTHKQQKHHRHGTAAYQFAIPIRRVSYKLQHSPLVKCYLMQHGGKQYPHLASHMRWSENPSRPVKTMALNETDRRRMRIRNTCGTPCLRMLPNVTREVAKVAEFRKDISKRLESAKDAHRREVSTSKRMEWSRHNSLVLLL